MHGLFLQLSLLILNGFLISIIRTILACGSRQTLHIDLESDFSIGKAGQQFLLGSMVLCNIVRKALFPLQESEDRCSNLGSVN